MDRNIFIYLLFFDKDDFYSKFIYIFFLLSIFGRVKKIFKNKLIYKKSKIIIQLFILLFVDYFIKIIKCKIF